MASPLITVSEYWAGSTFALLARIRTLSGSNVTQASLASIAYSVWAQSNPANVSSGTLTIASVIFDTLQTDYNWDTTRYPNGYNFRWIVPATLIPNDDEVYRFKLLFTDTSTPAQVTPLVHDRKTRSWTKG